MSARRFGCFRETRSALMETPGCVQSLRGARFCRRATFVNQRDSPMSRNVFILDGHPDPTDGRLIHALAAAYREERRRATTLCT